MCVKGPNACMYSKHNGEEEEYVLLFFIQSGNVVFEKHLERSSDNATVFIDYYASEIVELKVCLLGL